MVCLNISLEMACVLHAGHYICVVRSYLEGIVGAGIVVAGASFLQANFLQAGTVKTIAKARDNINNFFILFLYKGNTTLPINLYIYIYAIDFF